jgi:hypothetical protein
MRAHHREHARALGGALREEALAARGAQELDAPEDLLGRLRAVARELGDPSVANRLLERLDRIDAECVVQRVDPGGRESGDAQQIQEAGGGRRAKLLEVGGLARLDEVAHDGERGGAKAARAGEPAALVEGREVVGVESEERRRGLLVRA